MIFDDDQVRSRTVDTTSLVHEVSSGGVRSKDCCSIESVPDGDDGVIYFVPFVYAYRRR